MFNITYVYEAISVNLICCEAGGTVGSSYSWVDGNSFLSCPLYHIHSTLLAFFSVSLPHFSLAVTMHECFGKHLCMSFTFPIAIRNDTCSFRYRRNSLYFGLFLFVPVLICNQSEKNICYS